MLGAQHTRHQRKRAYTTHTHTTTAHKNTKNANPRVGLDILRDRLHVCDVLALAAETATGTVLPSGRY